MIVSPSHRAHLQASMLEGASKVAQSPSLKTSSSSSSRACKLLLLSHALLPLLEKYYNYYYRERPQRPLKHFIWVVKETEKAPYYRKWHWTLPMQMVGFLSMQERGETTHKLKKYFPNWCSMHYSILLFCDNVTMEFAGQVQIVNMATMPVFESCFTL